MNEQELAVKIEAFMKQYDPAEFGCEESNGGETYAKAFSRKLAEHLSSLQSR